ncbi:unnamed protein product [Clavelina lepadiformis]|uniref:G-protein coupled receptors family 1 profile domain-containing protein n=1 Tax=Clavelina lepadiformis TaxID=159417 RepID=A0ABP0FK18_CLALP
MMTAIAIILFCIFTVGFTGNSIILLVLLRNRRDWQSCTIFLFNLAVADTVFLLSVPFWGLYYLHGLNWQFGEISCKLMSGITSVNMYGSIFFLTAMSIDRWAAVVHPHTLGLKRTRKIMICTCYGLWIAAGILSVPRYVFQVIKTITIKNVSLNITSVGLPLTDNLATVPNSMVSSKTTTTQWSGSPQSVTQCILAVPEAYSMSVHLVVQFKVFSEKDFRSDLSLHHLSRLGQQLPQPIAVWIFQQNIASEFQTMLTEGNVATGQQGSATESGDDEANQFQPHLSLIGIN